MADSDQPEVRKERIVVPEGFELEGVEYNRAWDSDEVASITVFFKEKFEEVSKRRMAKTFKKLEEDLKEVFEDSPDLTGVHNED